MSSLEFQLRPTPFALDIAEPHGYAERLFQFGYGQNRVRDNNATPLKLSLGA